jgi:hypothetical protein
MILPAATPTGTRQRPVPHAPSRPDPIRRQANCVESSMFGQAEAEFLFAPYSVFTVSSVALSASRSHGDPHVITLAAAVDNRLEPTDLPLTPWY